MKKYIFLITAYLILLFIFPAIIGGITFVGIVILIANVFTHFVTKHCFSDDANNDEDWL